MKSKLIFILLLPFSFLYGIVIVIRNFLFDIGLIPVYKPKTTTISIGNLKVGGTGKTPHVEFFINLLNGSYKIAVLSLGYGRKTKGYIQAGEKDTSLTIGDEPLQYFKKYRNSVTVAVAESRKKGIKKLQGIIPPPDIIILDDAYQHRYVKPSLSILLTEYDYPFYNDTLLPSGRLREPKYGYKRADIIIVTKCPKNLNPIEKKDIIIRMAPKPYQQVFFSFIDYGKPIPLTEAAQAMESTEELESVVLFTGIADPKPLYEYLSESKHVVSMKFPDHHEFTNNDFEHLKVTFHANQFEKKAIFTTEKDSMRLTKHESKISSLPIFYIPIKVNFGEQDKVDLEKQILDFINEEIRK